MPAVAWSDLSNTAYWFVGGILMMVTIVGAAYLARQGMKASIRDSGKWSVRPQRERGLLLCLEREPAVLGE
jgi:hypothetical protein